MVGVCVLLSEKKFRIGGNLQKTSTDDRKGGIRKHNLNSFEARMARLRHVVSRNIAFMKQASKEEGKE